MVRGYGSGRLEVGGRGQSPPTRCQFCGRSLHQHDKEKMFPDGGPAGSWSYEYVCPSGTGVKKR